VSVIAADPLRTSRVDNLKAPAFVHNDRAVVGAFSKLI
jgi:hypothetical protein